MKSETSEVNNKKPYESPKSRMKKKHKTVYVIGSIGIAAASIFFVPKVIDGLNKLIESYER